MKPCAKCNKVVYPTEELKCLDKTWHKVCFKCHECGMALTMKNYKGYDKLPYCNAHYPTTKYTAVADTPENRRIAANTAIQSNIKYHKQFEEEKGKKISVADDPETSRVRKNMATISNVSYHGDHDKKQMMETRRPSETGQLGQKVYRRQPGSIHDVDPKDMPVNPSPYSARSQPTNVYSSTQGPVSEGPKRRVGSITDYDPVNDQWGSIAGSAPPAQPMAQAPRTHSNSYPQKPERQPSPEPPAEPAMNKQEPYYPPQKQSYQAPPPQKQSYQAPPPQQQSYQAPPPQKQSYQAPPPAQPSYQAPPPQQPPPSAGPVYLAMYDYDAADADEISFLDGDRIINTERIDDGWMTGTVERTGQHGMLPANYVELQ